MNPNNTLTSPKGRGRPKKTDQKINNIFKASGEKSNAGGKTRATKGKTRATKGKTSFSSIAKETPNEVKRIKPIIVKRKKVEEDDESNGEERESQEDYKYEEEEDEEYNDEEEEAELVGDDEEEMEDDEELIKENNIDTSLTNSNLKIKIKINSSNPNLNVPPQNMNHPEPNNQMNQKVLKMINLNTYFQTISQHFKENSLFRFASLEPTQNHYPLESFNLKQLTNLNEQLKSMKENSEKLSINVSNQLLKIENLAKQIHESGDQNEKILLLKEEEYDSRGIDLPSNNISQKQQQQQRKRQRGTNIPQIGGNNNNENPYSSSDSHLQKSSSNLQHHPNTNPHLSPSLVPIQHSPSLHSYQQPSSLHQQQQFMHQQQQHGNTLLSQQSSPHFGNTQGNISQQQRLSSYPNLHSNNSNHPYSSSPSFPSLDPSSSSSSLPSSFLKNNSHNVSPNNEDALSDNEIILDDDDDKKKRDNSKKKKKNTRGRTKQMRKKKKSDRKNLDDDFYMDDMDEEDTKKGGAGYYNHNNFWNHMKPYIIPITNEHLAFLQPTDTANDPIFDIPTPGFKSKDKKILNRNSTTGMKTTTSSLKSKPSTPSVVSQPNNPENIDCGELTSRIFSALTQEKIIPETKKKLKYRFKKSELFQDYPVSYSEKNIENLEDRIKNELAEIGLFDSFSAPLPSSLNNTNNNNNNNITTTPSVIENPGDDENITELKELQQKLLQQINTNNQNKKELLQLATMHMRRDQQLELIQKEKANVEKIFSNAFPKQKKKKK